VLERLDQRSGLTVVTDPIPAAFARTEARVSRSARDYVYLGPVEINERGTRHYLLWVGLGSTVDRDAIVDTTPLPVNLYIDADSVPIELPLAPWSEREPRLDGQSIYHPVVAPAIIMAARVTLDQLALIQQSEPNRIRLAEADAESVEFIKWRDDALWPEFIDYAGLNPGR
jgi:hypothetical protein